MNRKLWVIGMAAVLGLAACGGTSQSSDADKSSGQPETPKSYTLNTYTAVSPSNWNELTYQDNNDTQIMTRIGGAFFTYDYQKDANGKIDEASFQTVYDGATKLEDVTLDYRNDAKYAIPATAASGYAYKITLRNDLKWDDGTSIKAADFVYSMQEQLNPLFQNYRADSFYTGSLVLHNAYNYFMQGQSDYFPSKDIYGGVYNAANDGNLIFTLSSHETYGDSYIAAFYKDYYASSAVNYYAVDEDGNFVFDEEGNPVTKRYGIPDFIDTFGFAFFLHEFLGVGYSTGEDGEDVEDFTLDDLAALEGKTFAEIKADDSLRAVWDYIIGWWQTDPGEELDFFVTHYTFPVVDFANVGILTTGDLELVIVLDSPLELLKEDGSLSYKAAYNLQSLPLVKRDLYEANKVAPAEEGALWTSKYNSSLETTAAWGPYKLTYFQAGKQYILEQNPNWYGWNMPEYEGQYQTQKIVCDTIAEFETAWQAFQKGDIYSIGVDVSIADDYKNSSRAVFSGDDYISSLQLQSNAEALKGREEEGIDKEILTYVEFRQALSLGINRADYTQKCTTASLPGFGIFNEYHFYDVENGGIYRHSDQAKQVICDVYDVDPQDYPSLDDAYNAVTGYNPTRAKALIDEAYDKAFADGKIAADDRVVLTWGTSVDNENTRRAFNYINEALKTLAVGTKLENRLELEFNSSFGSSWANDFRNGAYDICNGAWSGAAWDPGYFLLAYLADQYRYARGWDPKGVNLTLNPWGDNDEAHNLTMNLMDWYNCLNGATGAAYNWAEGVVPSSFRLNIIAALEGEILKTYYVVPLYNWYSATLISYKVDYISTYDNTFMGYGGLRYLKFNYDDAAWETVKATFDYKA